MLHRRTLRRFYFTSITLAAILLTAFPLFSAGQDPAAASPEPSTPADPTSPPADSTTITTEPNYGERIVKGRPFLYFFKRDINPLTWLEQGIEPVYDFANGDWVRKLTTSQSDRNKTAGVKFGLAGFGSASGVGPVVTPYDNDLFKRGIEVEAPLVITYRNYQLFRFNSMIPLGSPTTAGRFNLKAFSWYASRASDNFYGIGNSSPHSGLTQFRTVSRTAGIGFSARLSEVWSSGAHAAYSDVGVTRPHTGVSTQDVFSAADVPGLFTGAHLGSIYLSVKRNTQNSEYAATSGGTERFDAGINKSVGGLGDFSYWKYFFYFQRFIPLNWDHSKVVALRGMAETNQANNANGVPFFEMPILGTWNTLRGFDYFRFRDNSALSLGAEYRYRIRRNVNWAFFVDTGQVGSQPGDFALNAFHTGYGGGLIILAKPDFPIRFDVARSNESWRFYFRIKPDF